MATRRQTSARGVRSDVSRAREAAMKRTKDSLNATEKAARALRNDVSVGGRDLQRNLERVITSTRKDLTKLEQAVRKDVSQFQKALTSPQSARPQAQRKRSTAAGARKRSTSSGARKRSTSAGPRQRSRSRPSR